jgi:hypothetical protein
MDQSNIFGYILSVLERRLAAYFGDDKNLQVDEKELTYITEKRRFIQRECYRAILPIVLKNVRILILILLILMKQKK